MPLIITIDGYTPEIDPTAWVAPTATLIGRVRIGPRASVFYGAVLRGDIDWITLGAGSNIQDNCVVHTGWDTPTRIGADVSVGHGAVIHGSTVHDGALIGMNATLLNYSVVGAGTLIAAGALVLEHQEIGAGVLAAGVPAKERGPLDEAGRAAIASNTERYLEVAAIHAAATS